MKRILLAGIAVATGLLTGCMMQDTSETHTFLDREYGLDVRVEMEFYNLKQNVMVKAEYGQTKAILCRFAGEVVNEGTAELHSITLMFVQADEVRLGPITDVNYSQSLHDVELDLEPHPTTENMMVFSGTVPIPAGVLQKANAFGSIVNYYPGDPLPEEE